MLEQSFKLRQLDREILPQAFLIVLSSFAISFYWNSCELTCQKFFWNFWLMIWLPVACSYVITSLFFESKQKLTTLQRIATLLLAGTFDIILAFFTEGSESSGYIMLFYIFLFMPVQIVLVLIIDVSLYFYRKIFVVKE